MRVLFCHYQLHYCCYRRIVRHDHLMNFDHHDRYHGLSAQVEQLWSHDFVPLLLPLHMDTDSYVIAFTIVAWHQTVFITALIALIT